eukprot:Rhum_TRINITY_DN11148_c2_g1::Rhum_TRINITY_DN11148_c2_g1_i1::g.42926::m.42926
MPPSPPLLISTCCVRACPDVVSIPAHLRSLFSLFSLSPYQKTPEAKRRCHPPRTLLVKFPSFSLLYCPHCLLPYTPPPPSKRNMTRHGRTPSTPHPPPFPSSFASQREVCSACTVLLPPAARTHLSAAKLGQRLNATIIADPTPLLSPASSSQTSFTPPPPLLFHALHLVLLLPRVPPVYPAHLRYASVSVAEFRAEDHDRNIAWENPNKQRSPTNPFAYGPCSAKNRHAPKKNIYIYGYRVFFYYVLAHKEPPTPRNTFPPFLSLLLSPFPSHPPPPLLPAPPRFSQWPIVRKNASQPSLIRQHQKAPCVSLPSPPLSLSPSPASQLTPFLAIEPISLQLFARKLGMLSVPPEARRGKHNGWGGHGGATFWNATL